MARCHSHSNFPITLIVVVVSVFCYNFNGFVTGQSILDRFRPNSNANISTPDEQVKIISGTKVKRFERLTVPLGGGNYNLVHQHPSYLGLAYVAPHWQAGAKLTGEGIDGLMTFQQLPYNNDVKVTLNATGIPAGKHALHIHTYGDLTEGCTSTGGQFANNFLGNIDVKENGEVSVVFISIYLTLFGYNGIIGRSIVIHERPIDLNSALNAEVFSSPAIHAIPDAQAYQNEENSVGAGIACGIISIMKVPAQIPTINK
ncbi:superoxide dismutase [Cu-Zn] 5 isoform X2 [Stomoxys calcitrans]|uniref:superoxide dismutase n=1 Tax=Stomoxys calcitrans TaxID=35570 RepID=A0A1I8PLQ3_STOCA|nr:superoxide dismutase [Cu-Zn] 5 isoform X2 [Stomoxys calcitrans]